jgi:hypothetical protein
MSDTETSARTVHSTAQEEVKRDNSGLIPRFNKPTVKAKMKANYPRTKLHQQRCNEDTLQNNLNSRLTPFKYGL